MTDDLLDDEEPSGLRKIIGERTTERDQALARAEAAERKLAFRDAGIPNTPMAQYFADTYQGDLSAEAIAAKAAELGLVTPDAQVTQDDQQRDREVAALGRIEQVAAGAQAPAAPPGFEDQLKAAGSEKDFYALLEAQGVSLHDAD